MNCIDDIVYRCIEIKRDVVEADEFDNGERMTLNFGHTLGHAIEKFYDYEIYTHGKAVSIGMCLITMAAVRNGMCEPKVLEKLVNCSNVYSLPYKTTADIDQLLKHCVNDKKRQSENINYIVCDRIGNALIKKSSVNEFNKFINSISEN
jgi:3-dehydroquinate synthase